jgi:hypothetical protein
VFAEMNHELYIFVLDGPSGPVTETKDMILVATDFYKDLFKWEARP